MQIQELAPTASSGSSAVEVRRSPCSRHLEVTFTAPALPGTLARFAGVLTVCRLDIVWATIRLQNDIVRDTFEVVALDQSVGVEEARTAIGDMLEAVGSGRVRLEDALGAQRIAAGPTLETTPVVTIETDSDLTTGIRIRAADRPGLLHDIAATISGRGLRTRSVTVLTVAGIARDTFRVVDGSGLPPRDAGFLESLRHSLETACRSRR
jgi:[protein-PII] uridylyltransferase